ncbi:MAG: EAL domain-containing protein [Pseudomonadota bacterium]
MMLSNFLARHEEKTADSHVRDLLGQRDWGHEQAEFLGHFLSSAFQPIVAPVRDRLETIGYEAFVRPKAGEETIAVEDYFAAMEPDNQAHVDALCRHLHSTNFLAQSPQNALLFCNIETAALAQNPHELESLLHQLRAIEKRGLLLHRLALEIDLTPDLDPGILYTFVAAIQQTGVKTVLEGFDADGASLARVVHIRPDAVKFNRSWLNADLNDPTYREMTAQMVAGIEALGAVAHQEFIESDEELNFAHACGFHHLQGYAIAAPSPNLESISMGMPKA